MISQALPVPTHAHMISICVPNCVVVRCVISLPLSYTRVGAQIFDPNEIWMPLIWNGSYRAVVSWRHATCAKQERELVSPTIQIVGDCHQQGGASVNTRERRFGMPGSQFGTSSRRFAQRRVSRRQALVAAGLAAAIPIIGPMTTTTRHSTAQETTPMATPTTAQAMLTGIAFEDPEFDGQFLMTPIKCEKRLPDTAADMGCAAGPMQLLDEASDIGCARVLAAGLLMHPSPLPVRHNSR